MAVAVAIAVAQAIAVAMAQVASRRHVVGSACRRPRPGGMPSGAVARMPCPGGAPSGPWLLLPVRAGEGVAAGCTGRQEQLPSTKTKLMLL